MRILNDEQPANKPFGLAIVYDGGQPAEERVNNATVLWFDDAATMWAVRDAVVAVTDECASDGPIIKVLDELPTMRFTIREEPDGEVSVVWEPKPLDTPDQIRAYLNAQWKGTPEELDRGIKALIRDLSDVEDFDAYVANHYGAD